MRPRTPYPWLMSFATVRRPGCRQGGVRRSIAGPSSQQTMTLREAAAKTVEGRGSAETSFRKRSDRSGKRPEVSRQAKPYPASEAATEGARSARPGFGSFLFD